MFNFHSFERKREISHVPVQFSSAYTYWVWAGPSSEPGPQSGISPRCQALPGKLELGVELGLSSEPPDTGHRYLNWQFDRCVKCPTPKKLFEESFPSIQLVLLSRAWHCSAVTERKMSQNRAQPALTQCTQRDRQHGCAIGQAGRTEGQEGEGKRMGSILEGFLEGSFWHRLDLKDQ